MRLFRPAFLNSSAAAFLAFASLAACSHLPVKEIPLTSNPTDEINKLEAARTEAVAAQVDVFSPEYYRDGATALKNAEKSRAEGDDTAEILKYVAEGNASFAKATEVANVAKSSLGPVVAARADALTANAPKFLKKEFDDADHALKDATRDIEDNDLQAADKTRSALTKRYADLELRAIKIDKLSAATATIDKAEKEGAKEIANRTFKEARKTLADADSFITANRHDKAGIETHTTAANAGADRLLDVSRQVKVADKTDAETVVLDREAAKVKLDAETAAGVATTKKLGTANATSKALKAENSEMASEQDSNNRLDMAKAQFTSDEADVYRDGNRLIIRIKTIAFPIGRSNLPPTSFPVLGKVQRVIEELDAGHVTVEGHTDTNGVPAANLKLSNERATAIGGYLAANGYDSGNISTVGYGDSKPLTTNKTKEGRAQNRRVDVIIEPQQLH